MAKKPKRKINKARPNNSSGRKNSKKQNRPRPVITGRISLSTRGVGFVTHPDTGDTIEIPAESTNTALHGDTVEISLGSKRKNHKQKGEVEKVVARNKMEFVGTLVKENGAWFLDPDDRKMYTDILIDPKAIKRARQGHKALVKMTHWSDPKKNPEGEIIEVIGKKGEHETEMRSVVLAQGFDYHLSPEVERAAKKIQKNKKQLFKEGSEGRRDMRDVPTFTIDPYDAKDFDDAASVRTLDDGSIEVGIHIADVSAYVKEEDPIDQEAQERGTSIYLVDRTIPMLPEVLSNDVCSLNPNEDKFAFSVVVTFDKDLNIKEKETWYGETLINSDKRFDYEEAQEVLDTESGPMLKELMIVRDITRKLRKKRFAEGSIAFETDEIKFRLDEDNKPIEVYRKTRQETNLIIEDLMLLANRLVAKFISDDCNKKPDQPCVCVYRIHDAPNPEKIIELATFLNAIGVELDHKKGVVTARGLNDLFKQIEGTPSQDIVETAAVRSMAKAIYSLKNIGHFGLAFKYYLHFTSPIRRYPDLMTHRILKRVLKGKGTPGKKYAKYEALCKQSTEREISAAEAERESVKYKQVEYMQAHVGEVFDGIITGVTDWGVFVEEIETKAEGLVRIRDLGNDYFSMSEHGYHLIGMETKQKIGLTDRVKVKLVGVDLEQKQIDWKIIK